jgi:hypothetical protein
MPKYNHAYTIAFEVPGSADEEGKDVTGSRLREALLARVNELSDDDMLEACDAPYDTFEEEAGDDD